jgi:hypothetical protein
MTMHTLTLSLLLFLQPPGDCHSQINTRCSALRGEEALLCRNEADAQCDIADAERFIAAGDVVDAESRINQACNKYEAQLNMLANGDTAVVAAAMVRYAVVSDSIFALLAREGEVEDLSRAVKRIDKSYQFLASLISRTPGLSDRRDLGAALARLTSLLAAAYDQLGQREMLRAASYFQSRSNDGDGGAGSLYQRAAGHFRAAYEIQPTLAFNIKEIEARLARADVHAEMMRFQRAEAALACTAYRNLSQDLTTFESTFPRSWKSAPELHEYRSRAERGARACTSRPRIAAGGAMLGVGAASLAIALGLYADYDATCRYDAAAGSCTGIAGTSADRDRYTAQVRASIGLATIGSTLLATGVAVMIHGLIQRKRARPPRFSMAPSIGNRFVGTGLRFAF